MKVRIMRIHPISNPNGAECWDGKVYECPLPDLTNVQAVGGWATRKTGFRFNYKPGHSRLENGRVVLFPARRQVSVHSMWLETA
jgi:hypothetical protein